MLQSFEAENQSDAHGNPAGGFIRGVGLNIKWQDGPLNVGAHRQAPNGAFVETVLAAARDRLKFYQKSRFKCVENDWAISSIDDALQALAERTASREKQGVEGKHEKHVSA